LKAVVAVIATILPKAAAQELGSDRLLTIIKLCGEGPGSDGGRQVDHEPAVCPCCQESQWDPGVH